jgi:zinc protease
MSGASRAARVGRPDHRRSVLDNGLTVLGIPNRRVPAVVFSLLVRGGAAHDGPRPGSASLTGGLLNKGTRRHSAEELALAIESLGASYSSTTGRESHHVTLMGLSEDAGTLLDLLAEIVREPVFSAGEFEILRTRRLHAVTRALDQPSTVADWTFEGRLFQGDPYEHPVVGTVRTLSRLAAGDPAGHHQATFRPGEAILAAAGDLDPDWLARRAESAFASWPAAGPVAPVTAPPPASAGRRVLLVHREDLTQAQIRWGHLGLDRRHPEYDTVKVMNDVLGGGGFSSRLMQRIRSEKGLTYGIHSAFEGRLRPGPFSISTFTPNESVPEMLEEIETLLGRYREEGPTEEELQATRSRFVGGYPLQFETPGQVAGRLLEIELFGLPADTIETYQDRIESVEVDDVRRAARAFLHPEQATIVIAGNADAVGDGLERFGAVERFDARRAFGVAD